MGGIYHSYRWVMRCSGDVVMRRVMRAVEQVLRYFVAFCVWLAGSYLLAMINEALFAIFLGSSMIIAGIYIFPLPRTDGPQSF
jgi:hypothetical protein